MKAIFKVILMQRSYTEYLITLTIHTRQQNILKHHLTFIFVYNLNKSNSVVMPTLEELCLGGERRSVWEEKEQHLGSAVVAVHIFKMCAFIKVFHGMLLKGFPSIFKMFIYLFFFVCFIFPERTEKVFVILKSQSNDLIHQSILSMPMAL